ncbi:DUF423 domain-containing protein [Leptospira sp. GIMC2001]|uniref:DUF423 domain-containing protein n=1 Tax=Leptospira sp. GIMC2001 TaxID=1513297 RepID=UPI00234A7F06|nr:DUF423 domain-containing protein [Leptospira sp. GIMC2001]WCL49743.1 DUF423 domain-containing protein [Leptospira sp. GIMC2001]
MNQNSGKSINWIVIGSISALFAVVLGAFGAHALKAMLTDDLLKIYETGNRYHFYHSFAILIVGIMNIIKFPDAILNQSSIKSFKFLQSSGWAFLIGIFVFSGSLYILAFTGIRILGAITPFGGISFMIGWLLFAISSVRK